MFTEWEVKQPLCLFNNGLEEQCVYFGVETGVCNGVLACVCLVQSPAPIIHTKCRNVRAVCVRLKDNRVPEFCKLCISCIGTGRPRFALPRTAIFRFNADKFLTKARIDVA